MSNNNLTLHHVSLLVQDTETSVNFYQRMLNLERITRPDLEYPGAWFQIGNQQMHLGQHKITMNINKVRLRELPFTLREHGGTKKSSNGLGD